MRDGSHYMIYTPSDPLLFVATKDSNGQLQIADDELLEDPATISAIDEETEFNALVVQRAVLGAIWSQRGLESNGLMSRIRKGLWICNVTSTLFYHLLSYTKVA
ncbi:hypothetical protein RJ640_008191 [Escallonia rubra]|uniref:Uncharacterized protein n=1 Tax=Escallonia rubra TaxID=112253 RepID=A0AA88U9J8_9ASTE|nr:hypothetical protein RJ640_008191 [Escallonia rubra]